MTALLTGFNEEIQVDILQGMNRIEEAFWTSMTVTAYLAERRAGGLKEIPPALLARKRAVDLAVEHMLKTTPGIQTIRLGGIGVGSGDEMVQIGQMLMAEGKSVEVRALELNRELVSEANRALQKTQIAGEVVHGSMNRSMDLQRICSFEPHLIVDHWAGCYDSLPIQKARFALIHEQLPQTAILFAAITDEWGVGKMIAGERQRNTETVQALSGGVEQMAGGIIHHMGHTYYVYPSQLELIQRLHASDSWLATQRSAVYGWLSTLLPREIAFGPKALILPDGQDALRVSAPYGAALQVWSCRYPLGILQNAATSTGWNLSYGEETLFGAGAALLFV